MANNGGGGEVKGKGKCDSLEICSSRERHYVSLSLYPLPVRHTPPSAMKYYTVRSTICE